MQNLAAALADFHKQVGSIVKNNSSYNFKYADLAATLNVVMPVLCENGLVVTQTFMPFEEGSTILRTTLLHSSGESVTSDMPMPTLPSKGNVMQELGSAITYMRRYSLMAILCLAPEDDDGNTFNADDQQQAVPKMGTGTQRQPVKRAAPPVQQGTANDLDPAGHKALLQTVQQQLQPDQRAALQQAFRDLKGLKGPVPIADYIKTKADAAFITDWITTNAQQPVVS